MPIIRLSENTVNLIAAGEVVERPSSVVKELIENSIDSGAKNINIYLEQSGKNLISVSDDGCGMSQEDMTLAIQRHTTSKLNEQDITDIKFFGFRGEALPSIASVSKMTIVSKAFGNDMAYQLQVVDNKAANIFEVAHNHGTQIRVQDLFGCIPARLKFLRSDQRELAACVDVVKKLALANPQIAFTLKHGSSILLKLSANSSLKERIEFILGKSFMTNAINVDFINDYIKVYGYIASPTYHKASSEQQFIFVNGRPVKDKLLSTCLKVAYQDYIVQGRFAPVVLFIEVPFKFVDVNVHPAKIEVRFQDMMLIKSTLIKSISEALERTIKEQYNLSPDLLGPQDIFSHSLNETSKAYVPSYANEPIFSFNQINELPKITSTSNKPLELFTVIQEEEMPISSKETEIEFTQSVFIDSNNPESSLGNAIAQLHNNYIVAQNSLGIIMIDQHAAHERIVYEQIKKEIKQHSLQGQKLLLPIVVELDSEKKVDFLLEQQEHLRSLALHFEKVGPKSLRVLEVPRIIKSTNVHQLIHDIADEVSEEEHEFSLTHLVEHIIETYACHHSIRSGQKLSVKEMNELLRQIENTPGAGQCCHGRPTYIFVSLKDIEKLFKRR
ncbi:DNA mismatch repair protein [Candidatus Phycorickettsia trachydisci]|uniref:DNA mismatch repair protein MutL n=1 Tax=Candidatus Phycorickettsia trachydisci TaxID=2115978 RepID=A0A2P1P7J5_9RICK|nr:DNA mismatch repair endonuclease MutL [Candidatus Phycorickettsia trachydisci]AVP87239.1 DNA mismatch repair protein [Candidatus Phycorickettsia trachydisci]